MPTVDESLILAESRKSRVFYGYIVVIACFFMMVVWWGSFHSFGVFFESLLREFGWSRAVTAGAFSLHGLVFGIFSIPTAKLCQKYGPRAVITICGVFSGMGYMLMSQISSVWQIYLLYGLVMSLGMSAYIPILPVVTGWFVRRRGFMTGVVFSGMGIGMVVVPQLVSQLISIYDWRLSYVIVGIVIMVVVVTGSQFLRRDPYQVRLLPYGADKADPSGQAARTGGLSYKEALRTNQFWLLGALYFVYLVSHNSVTVHIVIHAMSMGVTALNGARLLSVFGVFLIVGFNTVGTTADRVSNRFGFIISYALMVIAFILVLSTDEIWLLYLFMAILGFACGGMQVIFSPIIAELFGLKSHGVILASAGLVGGFGSAVGAAMAGYIFDVTGGYRLAFTICAVLAAVAFTLVLLLKPLKSREGGANES